VAQPICGLAFLLAALVTKQQHCVEDIIALKSLLIYIP